MSQDDNRANELFQFLTALRDEPDTPRPLSLDEEETALVRDLVKLSRTIEPDPSFTKALKSKLLIESVSTERPILHALFNFLVELAIIWRCFMIRRKRFVYAIGLGTLLVIGAFVATPLLAEFALKHFAPRQVEEPPFGSGGIDLATIPAKAYTDDVEEVEDQAGFPVLRPGYIPPNCYFREAFYLNEPIAETHLVYSSPGNLFCFEIAQKQTREELVDRPFYGEGSVDEVTINGAPAFYINGIWYIEELPRNGDDSGDVIHLSPKEMEELFEDATWEEGYQQLVFEQSDFLIRIDAEYHVSKEELIKIAESLGN